MTIFKMFSLVVLFGLCSLSSAAGPLISVNSPGGQVLEVNTTSGPQLPASFNLTAGNASLNEYPLDPFQMRVSGSTTSLIFSKYGQPIDSSGFYRIITWAQYVIIQGVIKSHGDGPVPAPIYEWSHGRLNVKIVRPLASQDLTWLMLANSLEGLKDFFDEYGWFVCQIMVLDDTLGPVATGSVEYG